MLEMLVALLVLSIGLLGVATLQVRGQQFNQVGYLRTQATFLAYDIMDRMRINVDNDNDDDDDPDPNNGIYADDGGYNFPTTNTTYPPTSSLFQSQGPNGTGDANDSCDLDTANCGVEALRDYDLDNWFNLVRETLPEGQAVIVWIDEDTNNNGTFDAGDNDIIVNGELDPPQYRIYIQWANIIDRDDDAALEEQQWILQPK